MPHQTGTSSRPHSPHTPPRSHRGGYRPDIDGLRGLAIALVVVFHVFVGRVSSGVDVFLLIGGIFFFGSQIRNAVNPRGLTVVQAFLRIFRRLYPALVTVVAVAVVASMVVYARVRWAATGEDATASLLYFQNLHLARAGQDYASINRDVSLFQHIWSMSAQLQIYVGSLLVITLVAVAVRWRWPWRGQRTGAVVLHWLLVVATVGSFVYAVYLHGADQGWNYYSPVSRFWEIGLGGLFGLWLLRRPLGGVLDKLRWPLGVVGVLLIIGTGVFLEGAAQFPGPWTLVPLAGAALVVLAGNPGRDPEGERPSVGVTGLLGTRPFQVLGRISYSLYLWHWPLLVLATFWFSTSAANQDAGSSGITATLGPRRGVAVGVAVIVVSLVLAWLTERFIETPLRQKAKPARSLVLAPRYLRRTVGGHRWTVVAALVMVVASVGVLSFGPVVKHQDAARLAALDAAGVDPREYPGPAAYLDGADVPDGLPVLPDPVNEEHMLPATQHDGCYARFEDRDLITTHDFNDGDEPCVYGDVNSERTMYLAGGSHSEHYLPGLDLVAKQQHIKLVPVLKMGCVLGMPLPKLDGEDYPECRTWDREAQKFIFDNPPTDGVFMTVTRPTTIQGDGPDQTPEEYTRMVRKFSDAGIHTWGVRDTPWNMESPGVQGNDRLCVADRESGAGPGGAADCGASEHDSLAPVNPALAALAGLDVTFLDMTPALCRDGRCPAVIGNVLVYRDGQHFSDLYSTLLAPEMARQMFDPAAGAQVRQDQGQGVRPEDAGAAPTAPTAPLPQDVHKVPKDTTDPTSDAVPGQPDQQDYPATPQWPTDLDYDGYDDYTGAPLWGYYP
jgi:peptidoglycan/LPS O-acetylase OafA/YrhL